MRSHAKGSAGVESSPASRTAASKALRSPLPRYCMTIEWKTTVAASGAAEAS